MEKKFGLIGAAGYIAPRHMRAIKETGNRLVVAFDPRDAVGVLDSFFPDADFFVEFERFDRHVDKLRRRGEKLDFVSICSPNYLHDSHIRWTLRSDADAICEKPLVLNPWNLDAIEYLERETGKKVYNVLQLRLHEAIVKLKRKVDEEYKARKSKYDVELTYITSRGKWYFVSWKGDIAKSGGVGTNIGIHFFDMLIWVFGKVQNAEVHYSEPVRKMCGFLELERAYVRWFLSVDYNDLPEEIKAKDQKTYRSLKLEGQEFEFSEGFTDLHTLVYRNILDGHGFGVEDARPSIELAYTIRNAEISKPSDNAHPWLIRRLQK